MTSADTALVAVLAVLSDIKSGRLPGSEADRENIIRTMELLATLGDENDDN